jgi:hypothetical protein
LRRSNKTKILDKIKKKNFSDRLEEILENKEFDEHAKSLLLSILYKIEEGYQDFQNVKQNVITKEEYIERLLKIIEEKCKYIELVEYSGEPNKLLKNKTFYVDKTIGKIICYPIERKILYAIEKISKKDKIIKEKYFIINKTLSDLINTGNNINNIECLRDFNGYSWLTVSTEIESIEHNLVYQNLRILLGEKFLTNWTQNRDYIIDYYDLYQNKLEEEYGKKAKDKIVYYINKISILLEIKFDKRQKMHKKKMLDKIEKELFELEDRKKYVEEKTKEKMKITKEIKRLDEILNDKEELQEEYDKRNKELPLERKIFSIRILTQIMEKERDEKIKKLEKINESLNPKKYVEYKSKLEEHKKMLEIIMVDDIEKEIKKNILVLQKIFLRCFKEKIEKTNNIKELRILIYEARYYFLLPCSNEKTISEESKLEELVEEIKRILIQKAEDMKVMVQISENKEINFQIIKNIFDTRIINLDEIQIKITEEKGMVYLQLFDEKMFEEKIKLDYCEIKKKEVKFNKKIKIFI